MSTLTDILAEWKAGGRIVIDHNVTFYENFSFPDKGITFGDGSTVIFNGGKITNETGDIIIIQGDNITLIANPEEIFVGDFDFRRQGKIVPNPQYEEGNGEPQQIWKTSDDPAQWIMERAYPQWFGVKDCVSEVQKGYLELKKAIKRNGNNDYYIDPSFDPTVGLNRFDAIPDASRAINAAIQLKQRGEVFIPRGWYKISNHINVLPGIQLRGESTSDDGGFSNYGTMLFPWMSSLSLSDWNLLIPPPLSDTNIDFLLSSLRFPWHPKHFRWYADAGFRALMKETGYMIMVNIDKEVAARYNGVTINLSPDGDPISDPNLDHGLKEDQLLMRNVAPDGIAYKAIQALPPPETEISGICIMDLNWLYSINFSTYPTHKKVGEDFVEIDCDEVNWTKANQKFFALNGSLDYRFMRGILAAHCVKVSNVRVCGLSQALCFVDNMCADSRHIEDNVFHPPFFNIAAKPTEFADIDYSQDRLDALYLSKLYAFELSTTGDALRFDGNHAVDYCEEIGALKISSCNGGSITGNILNSDVLIENSRGIDFAGNHMEYGATVTVATSAVSVRDNYIWRGTRPAITLRRSLGDAYNLSHWSAELSNNQLFWRSQHTPGKPQAAQSVYPYDIRTDGYGTLDIHNTFHTSSRLGPAEGSYFGLMMEWMEMHRYSIVNDHVTEVGFSEETATKEPFEEFNRISHIASASSHIEGRNVTPMPKAISAAELAQGRDCHSTAKLHFDADLAKVDEKDRWKINEEATDEERECTYKYEAWLFADYSRRLLNPNPYPFSTEEQAHQAAIVLDPKYNTEKIGHIQPDPVYSDSEQTKQYYNLRLLLGRGERSNMDVPTGPFWMYIERTAIKNGQVLNRKAITIPVTSTCMFWDNGEYLSGYAWSSDLNTNPASSYNLRPSRVIYHGANVECICNDAVPKNEIANTLQINGSWLEGDIIREMDGGQVVSWLKTASGWKTI